MAQNFATPTSPEYEQLDALGALYDSDTDGATSQACEVYGLLCQDPAVARQNHWLHDGLAPFVFTEWLESLDEDGDLSSHPLINFRALIPRDRPSHSVDTAWAVASSMFGHGWRQYTEDQEELDLYALEILNFETRERRMLTVANDNGLLEVVRLGVDAHVQLRFIAGENRVTFTVGTDENAPKVTIDRNTPDSTEVCHIPETPFISGIAL